MRLYLDSVVGLLQDRTAEELIVGVFLALVLAVAGAGVHALARRKVKDTVTLLTVVCLIANLVAMISTASYVRMKLQGRFSTGNDVVTRAYNRSQIRDLTFAATARTILEAADLDHDGSLSADEAAAASALFVESAEAESGMPVNWGVLSNAIRNRVRVFESRPMETGLPPGPAHGPGHPGPSGQPQLEREPGRPPHGPVMPRM